MRHFLLSIFVLFSLTGCCLDCTNTKSEYDAAIETIQKLRGQVQEYSAWADTTVKSLNAQEVKNRELEKAVFNARICDYVVSICPGSMTAPGRALIAQFGTKYDTPGILTAQIGKLIMLAALVVAICVFVTFGWLQLIAPRKKAIDELERTTKASHQTLEAAKLEAEGLLEAARQNADQTALEAANDLQAVAEATERELASLKTAKTHRAEAEIALAKAKAELTALDTSVRNMKAAQDAIKGAF